jgi:protein ERP2
METAQRYQNVFKNYEMHDRILIENNFQRINFWSIINLTLMIGVTIVQVITIRSLFETKSAYGKFLRGKKN